MQERPYVRLYVNVVATSVGTLAFWCRKCGDTFGHLTKGNVPLADVCADAMTHECDGRSGLHDYE